MRVVIVDTDVASSLFKGDTRGDLYKLHLEGDTLPAAGKARQLAIITRTTTGR